MKLLPEVAGSLRVSLSLPLDCSRRKLNLVDRLKKTKPRPWNGFKLKSDDLCKTNKTKQRRDKHTIAYNPKELTPH